jgi:uncharacterized protein YecE (DUF72 family)
LNSNIYIGTSGWSYPTGFGKWKGIFYPPKWSGDELKYYSDRFNAVEVNSSFYRALNVEMVQSWVKRTPAYFQFAVKLYNKFTHPSMYQKTQNASPAITADDVQIARAPLNVLMEKGRFAALLIQYPEFFQMNLGNIATLRQTLEQFKTYPLVVEIRHQSWRTTQTYDLLANHGATLARIDEPYFNNFDEVSTGKFEYWRMHGRNKEQWRAKDAGMGKYDYLYTPDEITEIADLMGKYGDPKNRRYSFFNNHPNGKAVVNAVELAYQTDQKIPFAKFSHMAEKYPDLKEITGAGTLM